MSSPLDAARQSLNLTWDSVCYSVPVDDIDEETGKKKGTIHKKILKDISGTARSNRLLAIMGPSGAGKTTLLNALAGRMRIGSDHVFTGTAYVNESIFRADYKAIISFVTQDDICMAKDTPRDAFNFSYRMRSGASADEATVRVDEMLKGLSLQDCADTILGTAGLEKGVSGGEKKRVNIGCELINDPHIMLLDEPTTGLDSVNADRIGELLQDLAHKEQRTVICTIHTPSSELFARFDDVLLLARGYVIYHGSLDDALAYFASIGHPVPKRVNPSEHYMKVLQASPAEIDELATKWRQHVASNLSILTQNQSPENPKEHEPEVDHILATRQPTGCVTEAYLLFARSFRNLLRDPQATWGRLIQVVIFSVFIGLFFLQLKKTDAGVQDRIGGLFMMAINTVFLNIMPALALFPPERAVFLHEQASGNYSAILYYFSKFFSELPVILILPSIYTAITYWMMGLVADAGVFFAMLLVLLCTANVGQSFGFMCAAVFPSPQVAMTVTPLIIMPLFMVAGLFANTDRLEPGWIWLNYISFPRYAYKAVMVLEFNNIGALCEEGGQCRWKDGKEVTKFFGFDKESDTWQMGVMALIVMNFGFRVIGASALAIQARLQQSRLLFEDNFQRGERPRHTPGALVCSSDAARVVSVPNEASEARATTPKEHSEPHAVSNNETVTIAQPAEVNEGNQPVDPAQDAAVA